MPSVLVVGAGLAGLNAAWRLHEAGIDVSVLEARDRVGGRTWSQALADGTVVERGGEFIAPDDGVLRGLAAELGLELVPHGFSFDRRPLPTHDAPTESQLDAFTSRIAERTAALQEDAPGSTVLTDATVVEAMALRRIETSLSAPLAEASARRLFGDPAHRYDPAVRVRSGNQAVALELARRLGDRVALHTPAVAVSHQAGEATVVTADGAEHDASVVIVAIPLPLLRELSLDPGPPDDIRAAAGRTGFGDAAKLHIPLAKPPAPGRMASPDATWWCWTSEATADVPQAAPVLSCFAGGSDAVAQLSVADALALRPDVAPATEQIPLFTHWAGERWTRGSYSVPGVGTCDEDDLAWTRPWGSVILAGEHTAGPQAATMNGAAASGARAAATALRLLAR
ncbi:MAG TPA: NAD(P)/FAD-dependent oxidoreductase [Solirubrobacteraceae bacterium]|nr:NAD(P)/FAD-dependent oxidoreductase [Solirubrobacteraceae bacterium]